MMIIDAHCHLMDESWLPRAWWEGLAKVAIPILERLGMPGMTPEAVIRDLMPALYFDPTGERQLQAMDEAGIDKAVLLPLDYGLALGEPPVSIDDVNIAFAELQRKYPDRFICLLSVDPRRPRSRDLVKKGLDEWGMRGVKFHPAAGYYPNSKETYALLEIIADRRVPVITHVGAILQPLYSKFCDPIHMDEVCVKFPEVTFIAAHLGHAYYEQLFHLGACKTNLWTDLSDCQRKALHEYEHFCKILRMALDNFSPSRVMFGTDSPYLRPVMTDKDYVQLIKNLPENAPQGLTFTEDEIQALLGGNAARLYGLI